MKRRDFLVAIATTTTAAKAVADSMSVPVNFESWNKFIESEDFNEYIYLEKTNNWYLVYRVNLTDKKEDTISYTSFSAIKNRVVVKHGKNCNYMNEVVSIPLVNKRFTVEDKQSLLKDLIRANRNSGKMFIAEIRIGNLTNLYGWSE